MTEVFMVSQFVVIIWLVLKVTNLNFANVDYQAKSISFAENTAATKALLKRKEQVDLLPPGYDKFKAKEQLIRDVENLLLENPKLHQAQSSNIIQLRQLVR